MGWVKSPSSVKKIAVYLKEVFTLLTNYLGVCTPIPPQDITSFNYLQYIIKLNSGRDVDLNQKHASAIGNIIASKFLTFFLKKRKPIESSLEAKNIYTTGHLFSARLQNYRPHLTKVLQQRKYFSIPRKKII